MMTCGPMGHSIECRITAEDAGNDFMPSVGTVETYVAPGGPGVRVDSHLFSGYTIPPNYDSLLGKIIVWGKDRDEAVARMERALRETIITGVVNTIPFHSRDHRRRGLQARRCPHRLHPGIPRPGRASCLRSPGVIRSHRMVQ